MYLEAMMAMMAALASPTDGVVREAVPHQVLELRQYQIAPGQRDLFVSFFENRFLESQEEVGMRLVGQFRDRCDPDRFTWIRSFPDMEGRERALNAFYFGPVWQANREAANPLLDDNDNVLLLRPASPDLAFASDGTRAARDAVPAPGGTILVHIEYLWKAPEDGFAGFFRGRLMPAIAEAGLPVIAAYLPEQAENNFPRLPVRRGEKLFVWFTRGQDEASLRASLQRLERDPRFRSVVAELRRFQEREPQQLWLEPSPRSALR